MKISKQLQIFLIFIFTFLLSFCIKAERISAIPYFARKYHTACNTCHFHFPKLNPLGEAFRKLGFRFPNGPYEDKVENEYVHDGGFSSLPVSFDLTSIAELERDNGISFNDLGGDFLIIAGGTINRMISFYGSLDFLVEGDSDDIDVIIPRMNVIFRPFRSPLLNVKVGRFEPRVMGVSNFRTITPAFGILNKRIGDNKWNLEPYQQGIELSGIFGQGRFAYSAGLVEGRGNSDNDFKDFYGRLEYKIGGMRLDGTTDGEPFAGMISDTWLDNSITIGIFGYRGEADIKVPKGVLEFVGIDSVRPRDFLRNNIAQIFHTPGLGSDDSEEVEGDTLRDRFFKVGADINLYWEKTNILAGYALQHHDAPLTSNPGKSISEHQVFLEIDYAYSRWFTPTIRYEIFIQENGGMLQRIQPQLNFMFLGPSMHFFISEDFVKDAGDSGFNATVGIAGFDIVF
ncbi:MAG: hypothetical protein ACUZ8O_01930 [Candidatus Anammoxibacter sp.]